MLSKIRLTSEESLSRNFQRDMNAVVLSENYEWWLPKAVTKELTKASMMMTMMIAKYWTSFLATATTSNNMPIPLLNFSI